MQKLLFATFNKHKCTEVAALLGDRYEIVMPSAIGYHEEPEEDADTLEDNALIKARALYHFTKASCFADDTGLEVEALDGAPGVHSARFAGIAHDDTSNRQKLLELLREVPAPRKARFRTVIAFIDADGHEHLFEGVVEGNIIAEERGDRGFGYDALFVPLGEERTFAEMSEAEKNGLSHRARAIEAFAEFLEKRSHLGGL